MIFFWLIFGLLYVAFYLGLIAAFVTLVCLALSFVLEPGWLYLRHKIQVDPKVQMFEVKDFLPLAKSASLNSVQVLAAMGFEQQASLWLERSDNTQHYVVVMQQPSTHDRALVKAVYSHQSDYLELRESHLEFHSELENGRAVRTSNTALLSPFGSQAHVVETMLSKVEAPHELHRAHRFICAQTCPPHGLPHSGAELQGEDALAYLHRVAREESASWGARDLVTLDRERNVLRLTYKGACLMSWGQLWPVSKIRRVLQENAADHRVGNRDATRAAVPSASTWQREEMERVDELASVVRRIGVGGSGKQ